MRFIKKFFAVMLTASLILSAFSFFADANTQAQSDFLRLHVRANSNTQQDQRLKLKVRDAILAYTTPLMQSVTSKENAIACIGKNLMQIKKVAENAIRNNGYSYSVRVQIDYQHFPYKEYDGFYLPEGDYDALIVEIGSGEGDNWWCALYPAVCLSGATDVEVDLERVPAELRLAKTPADGEIQFSFWLVELFQKLFAK